MLTVHIHQDTPRLSQQDFGRSEEARVHAVHTRLIFTSIFVPGFVLLSNIDAVKVAVATAHYALVYNN